MAGAWLSRNTAMLRPDSFMGGIKDLLSRNGVEILEKTKVIALKKGKDRAVAAVTETEFHKAGHFVIAAGAWTPFLSRTLGCKIPIQPGKGYSKTYDRVQGGPSIPCFFENERVVVTPWPSGFRLGGSMEFAGYNKDLNPHRLDALDRAAKRYLLNLKTGGPQEAWCGWRPMTHDGLPIIDHPPGLKNVTIAAGHNMLGMTMAPRTGKLVSELVGRETPHIDPYPYRINRFL
jgi:D-amino-acid dehydrogenase